MSSRFIIAPDAEKELDNQASYIAGKAEPETGARLYTAAEAAFELLARNPELGPVRDFGKEELSGLRMGPIRGFEKHLIFYRPTDEGIEIVWIFHASQDIEALILGKS
jgi:toxin ParE1/3/4